MFNASNKMTYLSGLASVIILSSCNGSNSAPTNALASQATVAASATPKDPETSQPSATGSNRLSPLDQLRSFAGSYRILSREYIYRGYDSGGPVGGAALEGYRELQTVDDSGASTCHSHSFNPDDFKYDARTNEVTGIDSSGLNLSNTGNVCDKNTSSIPSNKLDISVFFTTPSSLCDNQRLLALIAHGDGSFSHGDVMFGLNKDVIYGVMLNGCMKPQDNENKDFDGTNLENVEGEDSGKGSDKYDSKITKDSFTYHHVIDATVQESFNVFKDIKVNEYTQVNVQSDNTIIVSLTYDFEGSNAPDAEWNFERVKYRLKKIN